MMSFRFFFLPRMLGLHIHRFEICDWFLPIHFTKFQICGTRPSFFPLISQKTLRNQARGPLALSLQSIQPATHSATTTDLRKDRYENLETI